MDDNANPKSQTPNPNKAQSVIGSVGGKETAPLTTTQVKEWVSTSTPEVVLPREVSEVGVEARPVVPQISQAAQQAGVTHAKEAIAVESLPTEPLGMKTPLPVLKQLAKVHTGVKNSIAWLIRLIIKEEEKKEQSPIT